MSGGSVLSPIGGAVGAASIAGGDTGVKVVATAGLKPTMLEHISSISSSSFASSHSVAAIATGTATAAASSLGVPSCHSFSCFPCEHEECEPDWPGKSQVEAEDSKVNGRNRLSLRSVFKLVPSVEEAEAAIAILKQIYPPGASYDISENVQSSFDMESVDKETSSSKRKQATVSAGKQLIIHAPSPHLQHHQLNTLKELSQGQQFILKMASLLHLNPSLQRMVLSLSSDKAVWDAVMKNESIQELKESFLAVSGISEPKALDEGNDIASAASGSSKSEANDGASDIAKIILSWILDHMKASISGLIDKITLLVNEVFLSAEKENTADLLDDITKSSLKLTVMVFIVVVMMRIKQV